MRAKREAGITFAAKATLEIDGGLAKTWAVREDIDLKFACEVFNLTNSVRFNTNTNSSLDNGSDDTAAFGLYRNTLTLAPVQQFSLRFSF